MRYNSAKRYVFDTSLNPIGRALDTRSKYYDSTLEKERPYLSKEEVEERFPTPAERDGQFNVIINTGGTLLNGVVTGGTNEVWFWKEAYGELTQIISADTAMPTAESLGLGEVVSDINALEQDLSGLASELAQQETALGIEVLARGNADTTLAGDIADLEADVLGIGLDIAELESSKQPIGSYATTAALANGLASKADYAIVTAGLMGQGAWNAVTNTPTLSATPLSIGKFYEVSVAGISAIPTGGSIAYGVGDKLISNGTVWQHILGNKVNLDKALELVNRKDNYGDLGLAYNQVYNGAANRFINNTPVTTTGKLQSFSIMTSNSPGGATFNIVVIRNNVDISTTNKPLSPNTTITFNDLNLDVLAGDYIGIQSSYFKYGNAITGKTFYTGTVGGSPTPNGYLAYSFIVEAPQNLLSRLSTTESQVGTYSANINTLNALIGDRVATKYGDITASYPLASNGASSPFVPRVPATIKGSIANVKINSGAGTAGTIFKIVQYRLSGNILTEIASFDATYAPNTTMTFTPPFSMEIGDLVGVKMGGLNLKYANAGTAGYYVVNGDGTFSTASNAALAVEYSLYHQAINPRLENFYTKAESDLRFTSKTSNSTVITWEAIGDSMTYLNNALSETGNRVTKGYMTQAVEAIPNLSYRNRGVNGWNTGHISTNMGGWQVADIYSILLTTNDWTADRALGTLADYTGNTGSGTVAGAYRLMLDKIHSLNPLATVILITPPQRGDFVYIADTTNAGAGSYTTVGGKTLSQFADIIKVIADFEGLPLVDLYYRSGFNQRSAIKYKRLKHPTTGVYTNYVYPNFVDVPFNAATDDYPYPVDAVGLTYDGLHPSDKGNEIISQMLVDVIKQHIKV